MVRSVETIRKELKSLEAATATLAEEFDRLYGTYLDALGQAIRQQVVLATYHLCTQVYPDAFLDLSVSQQEALQKHIRQLGRDGQRWLQELMEETEPEAPDFDDLPSAQQERISRLTAALEAIPTDEADADQHSAATEDSAPDEIFIGEGATDDPSAGPEIKAVPIQFIPVDTEADEEPQPAEPAPASPETDLAGDLPEQTTSQDEDEPPAESGADRARLSKKDGP